MKSSRRFSPERAASATANPMSVSDSPGIRLGPLRAQLRLYCRALVECGIELHDVAQLIEKNIGWQRADVATTDGAAIFLPAATSGR